MPEFRQATGIYVPALSLKEVGVLSLLSEGNTVNQIGRRLGLGAKAVEAAKQSSAIKFGTKSLAACVHRAIQSEVLEVDYLPDATIVTDLQAADKKVINFYASGGTNHKMASQLGVGLRRVEAYHDSLLERVNAWSRPHLIRRSHELGLLD